MARSAALTQFDSDVMLAAVVQERHGAARNGLTVHGDGPDTAFDTGRVFNTNWYDADR